MASNCLQKRSRSLSNIALVDRKISAIAQLKNSWPHRLHPHQASIPSTKVLTDARQSASQPIYRRSCASRIACKRYKAGYATSVSGGLVSFVSKPCQRILNARCNSLCLRSHLRTHKRSSWRLPCSAACRQSGVRISFVSICNLSVCHPTPAAISTLLYEIH